MAAKIGKKKGKLNEGHTTTLNASVGQ